MKYIANPVEVDAYVIERVDEPILTNVGLQCSEGYKCIAHEGMTARMTPRPGDYVVIQSDGYIYLNPKDVFERKYSPKGLASHA